MRPKPVDYSPELGAEPKHHDRLLVALVVDLGQLLLQLGLHKEGGAKGTQTACEGCTRGGPRVHRQHVRGAQGGRGKGVAGVCEAPGVLCRAQQAGAHQGQGGRQTGCVEPLAYLGDVWSARVQHVNDLRRKSKEGENGEEGGKTRKKQGRRRWEEEKEGRKGNGERELRTGQAPGGETANSCPVPATQQCSVPAPAPVLCKSLPELPCSQRLQSIVLRRRLLKHAFSLWPAIHYSC